MSIWTTVKSQATPPSPLAGRLATQSLLFALGEGTFMAGSAVFFTQVVGLSAAQVGLGLTIAGIAAFIAAYPMGMVVDRIGPTWVFNAGQQFGAPPTHIIIDTEEGEALWFSSAGNQFIRFSEPLTRPVAKLEAIPDWLKAGDRPRPQGQA